jgi:hypothetical protein
MSSKAETNHVIENEKYLTEMQVSDFRLNQCNQTHSYGSIKFNIFKILVKLINEYIALINQASTTAKISSNTIDLSLS